MTPYAQRATVSEDLLPLERIQSIVRDESDRYALECVIGHLQEISTKAKE